MFPAGSYLENLDRVSGQQMGSAVEDAITHTVNEGFAAQQADLNQRAQAQRAEDHLTSLFGDRTTARLMAVASKFAAAGGQAPEEKLAPMSGGSEEYLRRFVESKLSQPPMAKRLGQAMHNIGAVAPDGSPIFFGEAARLQQQGQPPQGAPGGGVDLQALAGLVAQQLGFGGGGGAQQQQPMPAPTPSGNAIPPMPAPQQPLPGRGDPVGDQAALSAIRAAPDAAHVGNLGSGTAFRALPPTSATLQGSYPTTNAYWREDGLGGEGLEFRRQGEGENLGAIEAIGAGRTDEETAALNHQIAAWNALKATQGGYDPREIYARTGVANALDPGAPPAPGGRDERLDALEAAMMQAGVIGPGQQPVDAGGGQPALSFDDLFAVGAGAEDYLSPLADSFAAEDRLLELEQALQSLPQGSARARDLQRQHRRAQREFQRARVRGVQSAIRSIEDRLAAPGLDPIERQELQEDLVDLRQEFEGFAPDVRARYAQAAEPLPGGSVAPEQPDEKRPLAPQAQQPSQGARDAPSPAEPSKPRRFAIMPPPADGDGPAADPMKAEANRQPSPPPADAQRPETISALSALESQVLKMRRRLHGGDKTLDDAAKVELRGQLRDLEDELHKRAGDLLTGLEAEEGTVSPSRRKRWNRDKRRLREILDVAKEPGVEVSRGIMGGK